MNLVKVEQPKPEQGKAQEQLKVKSNVKAGRFVAILRCG